jgi:hypothetical protein
LNFLRRGCFGGDRRPRFRLGERLWRNFRHRYDHRLRYDFRRWLRNWRWCNRGNRLRFRDRGGCRFRFRNDDRFRLWSWRRLGFDGCLDRWSLCRLCRTFFWRANLR